MVSRRDDRCRGDLLFPSATDSNSDCENSRLLDSRVSKSCLEKRHVLTIWAFLGFVCLYSLRVNLSVAIVAMVNTTDTSNNDTQSRECFTPNDTTQTKELTGEFNWDEETQGWILGAFFYGYIVTQIPGGYLAARCGAKPTFGLGILCTAVLTLLTPLAARVNVNVLIALRALEGLCQGVTLPSMHAMWGNWAPVLERSRLTGFAYAGTTIGTVVTMPTAALLCDSSLLGGWPSVFYVFGAMGIVWFVCWTCIVHETPDDHPTITHTEQQYIETSIGKKELMPIPWRKILTCPALWGIAGAQVAVNWLFYMTLTYLPTYMKNILKFDIKSNGFLSGLPYLILWFMQVCSSLFADFVRQKHYMTTESIRKVLNTAGLLLPAVFIVGSGYAGCDHTLAVVLLTLAVGCAGMTMAGYIVNHLDIAPKFAGVLLGITNTLGTIPGFTAPVVVGVLTNRNETSGQWRIIFFITAGILTTGALIFVLLARGEEMAWARGQSVNWTQAIPDPSNIQGDKDTTDKMTESELDNENNVTPRDTRDRQLYLVQPNKR